MNSRILAVAASAVLLALGLAHLFRGHRAAEAVPVAVEEASVSEAPVAVVESHTNMLLMLTATNGTPPPVSATNWLLALLDRAGEQPKLPREVIDRWLASGRTNAEDLLAVRQAGGGLEFLRMALTNFPNDPRVLFAASALGDASEERRARLDRFKAAAPDNALADYLSARDHLKGGRTEEGLADLVAASGKKGFQDYTLDAIQNAEELYLQAGKSPAEAKVLGAATGLLPHLAQLKGLAQEMAGLQQQYLSAGDKASAERLARMGLQLAQHLMDGEGSRSLISQLVGNAVERISLKPLDAERNYDFLQGTAQDRIAQLDARRSGVRNDTKLLDAWMRNANDADIISYFDRYKIYGELGALAWLRQRQGAR